MHTNSFETTDEDNRFLTQDGPWMLLLHLLNYIPDEACAEIFAERKFLSSFDQILATFTASHSTATLLSNEGNFDLSMQTANGERPKKRRRLSPESKSFHVSELKPDSVKKVDFVLQVCCRVADIVSSASTRKSSGGSNLISSAKEVRCSPCFINRGRSSCS